MKKEEKTKITYNKILNAAIMEFGTKSYDNASINAICNENNIAKGLIYHNFKNKDELYLSCVRECFNKITEYLRNGDYSQSDEWENMKKLFALRQEFFEKNPHFSQIFFQTILMPPNHLLEEIRKIRQEFDRFNMERFKRLLKNIELREGITEEMAINYFFAYQEMFNRYFQNKVHNDHETSLLITDHETKLLNMLNVMLYGIAEQDTKIDKRKEESKID